MTNDEEREEEEEEEEEEEAGRQDNKQGEGETDQPQHPGGKDRPLRTCARTGDPASGRAGLRADAARVFFLGEPQPPAGLASGHGHVSARLSPTRGGAGATRADGHGRMAMTKARMMGGR